MTSLGTPSRRRPRVAVLALLAGLLTLGLGAATLAPASAERYSHRDKARDVVSFDRDDNRTFEPAQAAGDVVGTEFRHTRTAVVVSLRLRAPIRTESYVFGASIRTPRGVYDVNVVSIVGETDFALTKAKGDVEVRCPGLRRTAVKGRTLVRLSVPRSCLRSPSVVRVSAGISSIDGTTGRYFLDDALRTAFVANGAALFSPRLSRG